MANLSDEELANLSEEELEQAKKAKDNLLAIKKVDKEVETMENMEKWNEEVQRFTQEHGLTIEEAERTLKERMGLGGKPSELATFFQLMQPKPSPIEQAISNAVAARAEQIADTLFPKPSGGDVGAGAGGSPKNPLVDALQLAKQAGVQSLYLPDGTMVQIGGKPGDTSILKGAEEQITTYVTDFVKTRLPAVFNPPPGGPTPLVGDKINPEVARLVYEDKWKDEDRKAEDARAQRRDEVIESIAAMVGAGLSPEGFKKVRKIMKEGPIPREITAGEGETKGKGEIKAKLLRATCRGCMRVFPYEEGQDPICPYCGKDQRAECTKCGEIFIPPASGPIVCPKCHAELQRGEPETKEQEKPAPEVESPAVTVGGGLLE